MASSKPFKCVFFKLPPSYRPVSRIYEIAWNELLPQLNRLNRAFEEAQAAHPSSEGNKIWIEARKSAAKQMRKLQDVSFTNYSVASAFLHFLRALHRGTYVSEAYNEFQRFARKAVRNASSAQEVMIQFREDLRIAIGQIIAIMSSDDKDILSFITESNQSILEIVTAVEECGALLEDFSSEFTEVQQQSSDDKDNPPSDEEFQMVQEKWQAFMETADRLKQGWEDFMDQVRGHLEGHEPLMTPPNNSASPTMPPDPLKSHRVAFWRKFFRCRRISTGTSHRTRFIR